MLFFLAILLIALAAILYGIHYLVRYSRKGELVDKIPGPYAWPLIGNIGLFLIPFEELWILLRRMNDEYYPIHRFWCANVPVVNLRHPDDIEVLLSSSKHIEKSLLYDFLHPWLGTGLLTSTGAKWFERRRILTPAFHFDVLQQFVAVLNEQSKKFVQALCLQSEEVTCDILPLLHRYTLNSICETAMGSTSDMNERSMKTYRSCVSEIGDILIYRSVRPWLWVNWIFSLCQKSNKQVQALKFLHGFSSKLTTYLLDRNLLDSLQTSFCKGHGTETALSKLVGDTHQIIKERKQYHEKTHVDSAFEEPHNFANLYFKGKRRLAMLDLLISASKSNEHLDDEGIREEVDTFVFEGHDTTAMSLAFALLLLAENKEIQDKARAEVDALLDEKDITELAMKDIQSLTYLECCLKESLRLYPGVPFISRKINEDIKLKDYLVPGGTVIDVHIYDLHRDPNFWPNPTVYDPDRFSLENSRGRHPFAFLPFSAGPRNCIGQRFAMLELKVLVANILKHFYLEPIDLASEVRILPDLVLRPVSSVRLKFVRRSHVGE